MKNLHHTIEYEWQLLERYNRIQTPFERKTFLQNMNLQTREKYIRARAYYGLELSGAEYYDLLNISRHDLIIAWPQAHHKKMNNIIISDHIDIQFLRIGFSSYEYLDLVQIPDEAQVIIDDNAFNPAFYTNQIIDKGRISNPSYLSKHDWLNHMKDLHSYQDE